jgi:hypothetical protein
MRFRFHQTNQLLANTMEDLSRQVRIGHSAGKIDRPEQSTQNEQGTAALIRAVGNFVYRLTGGQPVNLYSPPGIAYSQQPMCADIGPIKAQAEAFRQRRLG